MGTLGGVDEAYIPVLGLVKEDGEALLALAEAGETEVVMEVNMVVENRTTYNVIAETKGGDHDNVIALGGHTDSMEAGPGINDNGSGSIGILTVAKALINFSTTNAVRFLWFSAEEFGLLGSEYVSLLLRYHSIALTNPLSSTSPQSTNPKPKSPKSAPTSTST